MLDELNQSLVKMNKGGSPGNDGIHPEVYLKFWSLLGPPLLEVFHTAVQKGRFERNVKTALITLLLKKKTRTQLIVLTIVPYLY